MMEYFIVLCSIFGEQRRFGFDSGGAGDGGDKNSSEDLFFFYDIC